MGLRLLLPSRPVFAASPKRARLRWCFPGGGLDVPGLPAAVAGPGALDLPVVAPIRGSSHHDGRGGTGAGEYLVADEPHSPAVVVGDECGFLDELFVQRLVSRCWTPVQVLRASEPSSTVNSPSISRAVAVIPSFLSCSSKVGETAAARPGAAPGVATAAVAGARRILTRGPGG